MDIYCAGWGMEEGHVNAWPMGLEIEIEQGLLIFQVEGAHVREHVVKEAREDLCRPQRSSVCLEPPCQCAQSVGPLLLNWEDSKICHDCFRANVLVGGGTKGAVDLGLNLRNVST